MSFGELIFLMALALILFGPEDLPVVARTVGRVIFELRKATADLTREFQTNLSMPADVIEKAFQEMTKERSPAPDQKGDEADPEAVQEPVVTGAAGTDGPEAVDKAAGTTEVAEEEPTVILSGRPGASGSDPKAADGDKD